MLLYPSSLEKLELLCYDHVNFKTSFMCELNVNKNLISQNTSLKELVITTSCPCIKTFSSLIIKTKISVYIPWIYYYIPSIYMLLYLSSLEKLELYFAILLTVIYCIFVISFNLLLMIYDVFLLGWSIMCYVLVHTFPYSVLYLNMLYNSVVDIYNILVVIILWIQLFNYKLPHIWWQGS